MVYLFLADGFEEIEALTPLDVLRRAQIPVCTVGVGTNHPCGTHDISVKVDISESELDLSDMTAVILPGGMPGTHNLELSSEVQRAIAYAVENKLLVAAICAAPSILGHADYLKNRKATCFPGFEDALSGAILVKEPVVLDGNFLTAKGAGVALEFSLAIVAYLAGEEKSKEIRGAMQCR